MSFIKSPRLAVQRHILSHYKKICTENEEEKKRIKYWMTMKSELKYPFPMGTDKIHEQKQNTV